MLTTCAEGAVIDLLGRVADAWTSTTERAALPGHFAAYLTRNVEWHATESLLGATWLEMRLAPEPLRPKQALARIRGYILQPLVSPPSSQDQTDPLRALDFIVSVLEEDKGLRLEENGGEVLLEAAPHDQLDPDFF